MKIINKEYNINNIFNKKIVLISDIHYYSKKDILRLNNIYDNIKKIKPNYICITGDTIEKSSVFDLNLLIEWLKKITNICKVFIVLGNHEFYLNKIKAKDKLDNTFILRLNRIKNLYFLNNTNKIVDGINFIGITLPIKYYEEENLENFKNYIDTIKTNDKYYNILLCHSPINISKEEIINNINVDLVLCGHMHGGIVLRILRPIFKTGGFISPQKKLFPKYAYGNIKVNKTNIITTSGIKVLSKRYINKLTNLFPSEIAIINL